MPILNYTTQISTEKTVGQIQSKLARAGATQVLFEFDAEVVTAISFRAPYLGRNISFRLPARLDSIYVILQNDPNVPRKLRTREQAARVAWRIIKDWLEAQLALIEAEQADMVEVFLPYAQNEQTGQTVYESMIETNFQQLEHQ